MVVSILKCSKNEFLMTIFLKFPVTIIQWANLTSFQPSGDTMEMKGMITHSPSHCALFRGYRSLIGLAFNAQIHDMVSANGAIINDNVPGPQSDGIPLFYLEPEI